MTTTTSTRNHRARWAAVGAAIAVSLGAGGIGLVQASHDDNAVYQAIEPCRILDTRPNQDIGGKTGGFGPNDTHTVQTQGGNTGQCDPLPSGITGVALNVTAVGASELTHLTFWASGPVPNSSSLNPAPGQPPTPNAVNVDVTGSGAFNVFNFAGSVQLIIDVVGFYTGDFQVDTAHIVNNAVTGAKIANGAVGTDKIANNAVTGAKVENGSLTGADIANNSIPSTKISNEAGIAFNEIGHSPALALGSNTEIGTVRMRVPADGWVTVHADIRWTPDSTTGADTANCQITKGSSISFTEHWFRLTDFNTDWDFPATTSPSRTFPVSAADNTGPILIGQNFNVICSQVAGSPLINSVALTAQYFPTSYAPTVFIPGPIFPLGEGEAEAQLEAQAEAAALAAAEAAETND